MGISTYKVEKQYKKTEQRIFHPSLSTIVNCEPILKVMSRDVRVPSLAFLHLNLPFNFHNE